MEHFCLAGLAGEQIFGWFYHGKFLSFCVLRRIGDCLRSFFVPHEQEDGESFKEDEQHKHHHQGGSLGDTVGKEFTMLIIAKNGRGVKRSDVTASRNDVLASLKMMLTFGQMMLCPAAQMKKS